MTSAKRRAGELSRTDFVRPVSGRRAALYLHRPGLGLRADRPQARMQGDGRPTTVRSCCRG